MEKELYESLKDVLDCFWDMSPLEFAQSRGLKNMSDEMGDGILEKARLVLSSASQQIDAADEDGRAVLEGVDYIVNNVDSNTISLTRR